jgi:HAE1 family hydrophobic/amphiphilic exporter-1
VRDVVYWLIGTWALRLGLIAGMAGVAVLASYLLMPPATYLPTGNRNLVFGVLIPPPGYSLDKMAEIGRRVEEVVGPHWRAEGDPEAAAKLEPVQWQGQAIPVPPVSNFFFVGLDRGLMFTGAISADPDIVDPVGILLNSVIQEQPGILGGARKRALIQTGGSGSGIEMELSGESLDRVVAAGEALFPMLGGTFGFRNVRPDPGNFNLPAEEIQVRIDDVRASDLDLNNSALATAVQVLGDGAIVDEYIYKGDGIDLKILHNNSNYESAMQIGDVQLAGTAGQPVPIRSVARVLRTVAPQQINRIERQKSVSFNIDVPPDVPVDVAVRQIRRNMVAPLREQGVIAPTVDVNLAGTAAKLATVKRAMLGEWRGFNLESLEILFTSRAFLALVVVFLVMAALFESWLYPLVILFTVPLATVGGFLGLRAVHEWTSAMPFVEAQQLDVLTMLGFVILIGIVVNNAILIVHQALNFMRGEGDIPGYEGQKVEPRRAIAEAVRTRVRPVLMSTFTSIGGMLPLVLFPGAGSELYRGLGSVVVGGLLVAGVFTLLLTPLLMSVVFDIRKFLARGEEIKV